MDCSNYHDTSSNETSRKNDRNTHSSLIEKEIVNLNSTDKGLFEMKYLGKNIIKHSLVLVPITLILSGCSTITYVEPKSGPVARVRFVTDTDEITIVRSYNSTSCDGEKEMLRLRNGLLLNSTPKRLNMPLWDYHRNAAKEFFVSSNNQQIYMFEGGKTNLSYATSCGVAIKQQFEEGKDYEVSYKWNNSNCYVEVSEIKKNSSGGFDKILLQNKDCKLNNEFSKSCLAKFKELRLW